MRTQKFCLIKDIDGTPTKFLIRKSFPRLLPKGYTLVDGITTDGVAYIDTGIIPDTTSKWDFYGTFKVTQSGDQVILGSRQDAGNTRFFPFATAVSGTSKSNYAFSAYAYGNDLPLGTKYHVYTHLEAGAQSSQVEGSARPDTRGLDFPSGTVLTKPMYLFRNNYTSPNACKDGTTCWYIKGVKNGVTVCVFVSCKRDSDNAYGLYDFVTDTFHGNANTLGTLSGGQDIIEVEYLQSSGVEYIDTGLKGDQDTDYDVIAQFVGSSLNPVSRAFGTRTAAQNKSVSVAGYQGSLIIGYGNKEATISFDYDEHNYQMIGDKAYVDGVLKYTFTPSAFTTDNTIILFGGRNASSMSLSAWKYKKCYFNNNLGTRDYVPVRIGTTGYMLDKANWRIYENAGSGAFTYGADRQYEFKMAIITPLYVWGNIEVVLTTTAANETFTFNTDGTKEWGDDSSDNATTHTYAAPGTYRVLCDGTRLGSNVFGAASSHPNYDVSNINIIKDIPSIGDNAFYNCSDLTSATIGDNVTSIGWYAFSGCSGLTSITIPDSVTSLGWYAFQYCSGLQNLTIGNSVTSIGTYSFFNCSSLTNVTIPDNVTSIAEFAFAYCYGLTSVTIGNGVTGIGFDAFLWCDSLQNLTIGSSVARIGNDTFSGCSSLTSITYNGTKSQWAAITKGSGWNTDVPATVVHCTDGDVDIQ